MNRLSFCCGILFAIFFALPLCAQTYVYREVTGSDVIIDTYTVEKTAAGYHVTLLSDLNEKREWIVRWETDPDFSVLEWEFQNPREGTHITAVRRNNSIFLSGIHKKNRIEKEFVINEKPWKQHFPFGLEPFVRSAKRSMVFWSIGTKGPGEMQAGEFYAEKRDVETITVPGLGPVRAVHVRMNLTGFLAAFWSCDTWFRLSDGRYLRYKGFNSNGNVPETNIYLNEEKP